MSGEVVPLARAGDETVFGGKAVQLATAIRGGLPVPDGFALSWQIVDRIANGDARDRSTVSELLQPLGKPVAVRSSAVGEDSAGASFAGQHLTRLGVGSAAALVEAIVDTWQSGRSAGAMAYRRRLGLSDHPHIGVVVQRMVDADCAGVMFTKDPTSGADLRVIEAAWGLGESVVSGLVDPDRYRVKRGGTITEIVIGDKHVSVRAVSDGKIEEVATEAARQRSRCLDDRQLELLDELAAACEAVFGNAAHDIEWAFDGSQLYLLQRRAVTR